MKSVTAVGTLEDGFRVRVQTTGHEYVLDTPPPMGGEDAGAMPGAVLLAGLAGCQAMSARLYFRQLRMEPRDLRVDVAMNLPGEGVDGVSFDVVVKIDADLTDDQLTELADFIDEKCAVGTMLRQANPVEGRIERV